MPRRPPSSADSSRPYTSDGGRPTTSAGNGAVYGHDPQYTYGPDYDIEEEEEEEESEDEDVFAFLPPSTAEQQQQQPLQHDYPQNHATDPPSGPIFANSVPSPHITFPSPTFDPYARFPADSTLGVGPSTPHFQYFQPPPQTPPSTDSHNQNTQDDHYRLRRLNTPGDTAISTAPATAESREVRVSLPDGSIASATGTEKDLDMEAGTSRRRSHPKRHESSVTDSLSIGRSVVDEDDDTSREGSIKMEFDFDAIDDEDSPFPEVRASVSNIDDPDMPALTIRMWFVGLLLCMISSGLNVFFNFRSPAPTVVPLALLLISYPFGKFLAFTLPITTYRIPIPNLPSSMIPIPNANTSRLSLFFINLFRPLTYPRAIEFSLNPGPWNIKEHVLVFIMANVAVGNPYALNAVVVSEVYYDLKLGYWFALVLVLATQLTGFGLAGLCRRFLVWPASMVWPQNLVACTLLNTLHAEDEDDGVGMGLGRSGKGMSRYRFFMIVMVGSFFFFFLPGFLFEALSVFSFICWAAPDNVPVNQIFGVHSGLGFSVLTFDWTQISWIGSPLMVPWWAEVHIFLGFVMFYWILTPALYYSNSWSLAYFPISANEPYDRYGNVYDITRVLTKEDRFDVDAYNAYSPLYLPATYAMTYLLAFALSTCVIIHTLLYHGRSLLNGIKKMKVESDDIHAKLMRNYPEVPDWWYLSAFAVFFGLAVVAVEVWDTNVPVWALLLSLLLPVVYILPSGFIYAMTGQGITLNILAQIIPGTLLPGNPLANMVFKAYAVQTLTEATSFIQDLKLGHYIKVPPRATFLVQLIATCLAAFIQVGVKTWIFANVPDICDPNQKSQLTCPHNQVFFTASAVWGLIGPSRQFGVGSIYHPHLYAMVIGVFLPIPFWLWQRRYPNSWVKYVSTPVIINGVSSIPPATGINYSSWFAVGFIFQYLIRKRNFSWWSKFNYVASAALDSGTVLSLIFIFFTLQFPKNGTISLNWWGNWVHERTADWDRRPFLKIPPGGIPQN
ncbi:putative OPT oligopeptide transporter protein [Lyophyllum shimeji]|uniref:OPT oligopeptide transporter protein n=1 Tax=Lyophyllum shimeji TaxID=47721 RepID=A0A9P3PLE8_LYOSH|nr:putative OPT oligopeptide transporter protein [Lyophyllum shimeji]